MRYSSHITLCEEILMSTPSGGLIATSDPAAQTTNHTATLGWTIGIVLVIILIIFGVILGIVILKNKGGTSTL